MSEAMLVVMAMIAAGQMASGVRLDVLSPPERGASLQACFNLYTHKRPPRASSVEEWEERKKELRRQELDCLGLWPLPERVPLNVWVSAERQGEGYLLQRVYWQVYPEVEASGWLYVPNNIN
ncbi:MAG: hypothetical protein J7M26_08175, partial [Armatimonadetes bacterium]|nr:hypothetical protein [Armatimonadota bacterium]